MTDTTETTDPTAWPSNSELTAMTDTDLLDHGIEVMGRRKRLIERSAGEDVEWDSYQCDLRLEHIRDILRNRVADRNQNGLDDHDNELMQIINDTTPEQQRTTA